jgi:hypothetical protein
VHMPDKAKLTKKKLGLIGEVKVIVLLHINVFIYRPSPANISASV